MRFEDGREVEYDRAGIDELSLAYATTIHKSQGGEYPAVVVTLMTGHFLMLSRNLFYTAVTRRESAWVVLVADPRAVSLALAEGAQTRAADAAFCPPGRRYEQRALTFARACVHPFLHGPKRPERPPMVKRLVVGLIIGLFVGALVAAALIKGLGIVSFADGAAGTAMAYIFAAITGMVTGLIAGKPIWSSNGKIEASLKAFLRRAPRGGRDVRLAALGHRPP